MANVIIPLDMPKCVRIVEESRMPTSPNNYEHQLVLDFMKPLIEKLSARRPHWEFHSTQGYSARRDPEKSTAWFARFDVMEDGDKIGWIDAESRHHGMTYLFDNHRLSAKRTRGSATATIKLEGAYKQIIENMYGLTIDERLNEARARLSSLVSQAVGRARRPVREARDKLVDVFEKFAIKHWDEFQKMLNDKGKEIANPFLANKHVEAQMLDLDKARTDGRAVVVVIRGDNYLVGSQVTPVVNTRYTTDTLPENIKTGIGLLKLMEINVPVPEIGMKADKDQYLVVLTKEEPGDI